MTRMSLPSSMDFRTDLIRVLEAQLPKGQVEGLADNIMAILRQMVTEPVEPRSGWYCPHCMVGVLPSHVTLEQTHRDCGTYIGTASPPAMGRSIDTLVLRAALTAAERDRDRMEAALFAIIFLCNSTDETALENISLVARAMLGTGKFDEVISDEQQHV